MQQPVKAAAIRQIGVNGSKGRRIWLEGALPAKGGFTKGTRYKLTTNRERSLLTLQVCDEGMKIVSGKVKGEREIPIIDILSQDILSLFDGLSSVRVVVERNRIHILPVASELRAKRRVERMKEKIAQGQPLAVGGLASGIGILDLAARDGLQASGLGSRLVFANEVREDCCEHAELRNPAHDADTMMLNLPMQEMVFDPWLMAQIPECDVLTAGVPCSGASVAGRTKRGLGHPEDHPLVGHLCVAFIAAVARSNPVAVVFENVTPYRSSASASIIRNSLRDLGYDTYEIKLDAADWNLLEHRRRFALVAVTKGIPFSFDSLEKPVRREVRFGDIMDEVPPDATTWGDISYLWAKQEKDEAAGKGFKPIVVDANSPKLGTLNATLHKRQSTGHYIQNPLNPTLYRIPTVGEHARAKGIDPEIVAGTTQTFGHETLGQSISMPAFVSVFKLLGYSLKTAGNVAAPSFVTGQRVAA